jgi:hypothetical protein
MRHSVRAVAAAVLIASGTATVIFLSAPTGGRADAASASSWPYDKCAPNTPATLVESLCDGSTPAPSPVVAQGTTPISQSQAEQEADGMASSSSAPTDTPDDAQLVTYSQASSLLGQAANPAVPQQTQVWIVTVYRPFGLYSVPPAYASSAPMPDMFTVILDASNGAPIDACAGCGANQ